ncbi:MULTISPECIES: dephospho-CoA kinase [Metabacillus]|uniref:Dephospho-CoA kinase n=1 Tax=Metabacillus indicus TaxID=246786 RepID=A0A084GX91_METID|nr:MULTISPECIES: dephospho-CoA kinase [Metabacillus]KEZ51261.1 dephospho-CoA kinase [Metabacillus indicus LMG 22858]KEZ51953.1 dephospho-CoA kinase [Metabacillus indicus]
MTLSIGLTGGIASGKSTVSNMFKEANIPVIDADIIARQVVEQGAPAYRLIAEAFGSGILQEDGSIDREKLGSIIFQNANEREKLNSIVHPAVRKEMLRQKEEAEASGEAAVVLDIPLLFESKLTHLADVTLVVYVNPDVQLSRLMRRNGLSEEDAKWRIASQLPLNEKKDQADEVIDNNGTIEETKKQFHTLLEKWNLASK